MESRSTKSNLQDRAFIQSPKVNRIYSKKNDKDIQELDKKHEEPLKNHSKKTGSSILKKLFDFIQSDDALLLLLIVILLQDGADDEILLVLIVYLLIN